MKQGTVWKIITAVELAAATAAIILDLFIPTIVVLGLIAVSLLVRREGPATLGFRKDERPLGLVLTVLLAVVGWTLLQIGGFMPALNHLTGSTQDLSAYADLKGNWGQLAFLLGASWTLAALGEEIVYRGYLQRRTCDLFGNGTLGIVLGVAFSSVLFGLAHREQGIIGVVVTLLDAVFFSALKLRFRNNLWASVLAHGFSNTIGIVAFFIVGPIYGLW